MKQVVNKLVLAVALTTCFSFLQGCSCDFLYKCAEDIPRIYRPEIIGKWQCVHFTEGFGGRDSNVSQRQWFLTLTDQFEFTEERDGSILRQGNYDIHAITDSTFTISFPGSVFDHFIRRSNDTLFLVGNGSDLNDYTYIKR